MLSMQSEVNPEELYRKIFGEFRSFGSRGGFGFGTIFEDLSNLGFGAAQETIVHLTFKEAASGVNKEVEFEYAFGLAR
jgi:hypothetical protein